MKVIQYVCLKLVEYRQHSQVRITMATITYKRLLEYFNSIINQPNCILFFL